MAKEAIEKVREAENKANEIVLKAERDASELLAKVGVDADNMLNAEKAAEAQKTREAVDAAKIEADKAFEAFKDDVSEKCENRRAEILKNKENIIGRIIEAVRKG